MLEKMITNTMDDNMEKNLQQHYAKTTFFASGILLSSSASDLQIFTSWFMHKHTQQFMAMLCFSSDLIAVCHYGSLQ